MKVSKMKVKITRVSNSRKTQTTELARQGPASAGPWNAKRGILLHFLTSIVAKHQKIERGPLGEKLFSKKVSQCRKNWKRDP